MSKVLFAVTSLDTGGIEQYLLRFLRFAKDSVEATVLCKSGRTGELEGQYEATHARLLPMKIGYIPGRSTLRLAKFLQEQQISCVCDFTGDFAVLTLAAASLARVPRRIAFYRESEYQFRPTSGRLLYAKALHAATAKLTTHVLSNSQAALNRFYPGWQLGEKFTVIANGVPSFSVISGLHRRKKRAELGIPENAFVIGHIGRLTVAKNHAQVLAVADRLMSTDDRVWLLMCGKDVHNSLAPRVSAFKNANRFVLLNTRQDIPDLLGTMDAFYFPSLNEGMPNALLEALLAGLPFVASNIPAIQEVVPHGYHRYLVAPTDADGAAKILESFIGGAVFPSAEISHWAKQNFDQKARFQEFLRILRDPAAAL